MLKEIFYCLLSPIFSSKFSPSFLFMPYSIQLFGKSSLIFQYLEEEGEGEGREGLGACEMRKRQVVVRRSEEPSRNTATSSYTVRSVWYGECQKNHAANVGGYAVDGCREFMASGEEGTNAALTCAACGCHRNFHRREVETEVVCDCSSSPSSN